MEFFRIIDRQISQEQIKEKIKPANVADFAETMRFLERVKNSLIRLLVYTLKK